MTLHKKAPFLSGLKMRTKLILLLVAASYLAIFTVGSLAYLAGRNIINERLDYELVLTTNTVMESINKQIFDRYNDIQILTSDASLSDPNISNEEKSQHLLDRLFSLGWYDAIYLTDYQGTIISSTNDKYLNEDLSGYEWFDQTVSKFIYVSDVMISPVSGKRTLLLSGVVSDQDNNLVGVLVTEFSLNVLTDTLNKAPRGLEVFLMSSDGQIIAKNVPEDYDPTQNENYFIKAIQSEGYLEFRGNGWELIVRIPEAIAYAPLNTFSYFLILVIAAMSIAAVLIGTVFSRSFIRPILQLTHGVSRIQKGDLKANIEVSSKDEVGFLAENFNVMTKSLLEKTNHILEEKGKYVTLLESVNEAIVFFDTKNRLIAMNQNFRNLIPKKTRILNVRAKDLIEGLISKKPQLKKLLEKDDHKKTILAEVSNEKPKYQVFDVFTKPVATEAGILLGRIWSFTDVTEQRLAEKSKNEFILVASHKLRTPLTAINWTSEMLMDGSFGNLSPEQKQAFTELIKSTDRLNELVDLLLSVAELQGDKLPLQISTFTLEEILEKALKRMPNRFPNWPSEYFKVSGPRKIFKQKVRGDLTKLTMVLEILLDNAVRYQKMNEQHPIEIKLKDEAGKEQILIEVVDQGIGIKAQDQSKVFSKFFRTEAAILQHTEGVGLNLFLAKMILDSSKEKIHFQSTESQGSSFRFSIKKAL